MSRTIPIVAVFEDGELPEDGSDPMLIRAFNLSFPQWTNGRLSITALSSASTPDDPVPFDITGGAFIFTARTRNEAAPPIISHEGDIDDGPEGLAHVDIASVDTGITVQQLAWNLAFVDADGNIWATTAQGTFAISPSQYVPGQEVTVPESQEPLAQGPPGPFASGGDTALYAANIIEVFARSTGSDTTGDGTEDNPYETPEHALRSTIVPLGAQIRINVTDYGAVYTPAEHWQMPAITGQGPSGLVSLNDADDPLISMFGSGIRYADVMLYAEPSIDLTIAANTYTWTIDSVTGRATANVSGAAWTVNEWADKMILAGEGSASSLFRVISNTTNTLTLTYAYAYFASPAPSTPRLQIQTETFEVNLASLGSWIAGNNRGPNYTFSFTAAGVRCETGSYFFREAHFMSGQAIGCVLPFGIVTAADAFEVNGCYVDYAAGAGTGYLWANARDFSIVGSIVKNTYLIQNNAGKLTGNSLELDTINGFGDGYYHGAANIGPAQSVSLAYSEVKNSVGAWRGLNPDWQGRLGFVRFTNCSYGGMRMERGAATTVFGYLAGTGNGSATEGAGCVLLDDSRILVQPTAELTEVALTAENVSVGGTIGELKVGDNAFTTFSDFFTKRVLGDPQRTGARIQQRGTYTPVPTGGAFYWTSTKTATQLYEEITAAGGFGTVYIPSGASRTITANTYSFDGVRFVGVGRRAILTLASGVLLDGGASVVLDCENMLIGASAALMTPGTKAVSLVLNKATFNLGAFTGALFTTSSAANDFKFTLSSIAKNGAVGAVIDLSSSAARLTLQQKGGPFNQTVYQADSITGVSGSAVTIVADAQSRPGITALVASPVTVSAVSTQWGDIGATPYASASRPTPSLAFEGQIIHVPGGAGVASTAQMCLKSALDTYSWVIIGTG